MNNTQFPELSSHAKIFFFRVCGTLMGTAAGLLKDMGYDVTGADYTFYPPMSTYLNDKKINLVSMDMINEEYLATFDLIVVGNSLAGASEHARIIERSKAPFASAPKTLGELLLKNRTTIGVCGTHGKTTTTYLMVQIMKNLGLNPGYLIGGVLPDDESSAELGTSPYFVIEADEYDSCYFEKFSKFHLYHLKHVLLTSLEFDHADIFNSLADIEKEFDNLLKTNLDSVIYCSDYNSLNHLTRNHSHIKTKISYHAQIISNTSSSSKFEVNYQNTNYVFETSLVGTHNIANLTACLLWLLSEGFNYTDLQKAVAHLKLGKRRQEERGYYQGALFVDDFAHHPRAVETTIDGIKSKYPNKKIVAVFEPISATARSSMFQNEFTDALAHAHEIVLCQPSLLTTVKNANNIDLLMMQENLLKEDKPCSVFTNLQDLLSYFQKTANDETVYLVMSNRTCLGLWESDFIKTLQ